MQIIDAQVHAWKNGESTGHHRRAPITGDVLLSEMAEAGVDRAVLVPPLWDPNGNAYSLELARQHPQRFAVMGVLRPDEDPGVVANWPRTPGLKGLRVLLNSPDRLARLVDGSLDALWGIAEDIGMTTAILLPGELERVPEIAQKHPRLRLIVDHLGVPRGASGPSAFHHLPALLALARFPNVSVKAVGVCDYALDPYPFASLDEPVKQIYEAFGEDRIIWGSDLSRLRHPYAECVSHFSQALIWLTPAARVKIMGGNLGRLLGWDL